MTAFWHFASILTARAVFNSNNKTLNDNILYWILYLDLSLLLRCVVKVNEGLTRKSNWRGIDQCAFQQKASKKTPHEFAQWMKYLTLHKIDQKQPTFQSNGISRAKHTGKFALLWMSNGTKHTLYIQIVCYVFFYLFVYFIHCTFGCFFLHHFSRELIHQHAFRE